LRIVSVFTAVSFAEAQAFLEPFDLGALTGLTGIAGGVENTNYFASTATGEYVLTMFETLPPEVAQYCLDLKNHLFNRGIACPRPLACRSPNGLSFTAPLKGKLATVVSRLPGGVITSPSLANCHAVGALLARLHLAAKDFAHLENWRGRSWREGFEVILQSHISAQEQALIGVENRFQAQHDDSGAVAALPHTIIHGDLFRDNVLWNGDQPQVIDFYFAATDAMLYDLAITVNDFCTTAKAELDNDRANAMLKGYSSARALTVQERQLWPVMLRRAALRTYLGRLGYNCFPRDAVETTPKDHHFSERLLRHHIANAQALGQM
jgi:homoserine kinase type II